MDVCLDPDKVIATVDRLYHRICERFPESGLSKIAANLQKISQNARERAAWIARPILSLRLGSYALIGLIVGGLVSTILNLEAPGESLTFFDFIQIMEAGINDVVLVGAALFFVMTLEARIKRKRALQAIHELRAVAHIIDMHQLTKDPERILIRGKETSSSPDRRMMTSFELNRYLDYCSEMLALCSKIAALYVQNFDDSAALAAVNEIETLTTGLARKVWQKLMILHSYGPLET